MSEIEAERGKGQKVASERQNLISSISNSFSSCLLSLRIRLLFWHGEWYFMIRRIKRWLYCRRGYHRLSRCSSQWSAPNKPIVRVDYLKCVNSCGYVFFATPEDKKVYQVFTKQRRKAMHEMFDNISRKIMTGENGAQA